MKKIVFLILLFTFTMVSCDSFLEEDSKGRLTADILFKDASGLDMAINGLYTQFVQTNWNVSRAVHTWVGDDVTAQNAGNKVGFAEYDRFNFNSGNLNVSDQYKWYYATIKACNNIIKNAEQMTIDRTYIEHRLGQAYFLRALNYFMLVRIWGRLPLVTEVEINYSTPRADVATIYELIESDALKAEAMLPEKHTVAPYFQNGINVAPNKAAAKALLASVYLTEAGWPLKKGASYYDKAAEKYKEIIDKEGTNGYEYILEPDIRTLVKEPECNYSKEIVFGEFHHVNNNPARGAFCEFPEESNGWCDLMPEIEFFNSFPAGRRKDVYFLTKIVMLNQPKDQVTGRFPVLDWKDSETNQKHPYFKKMIESPNWDYDYTDGYYTYATLQANSSKTQCIFRYADILLLYAEAVAFGSGSAIDPLAITCVKRVQDRAGIDESLKVQSSISKTNFQQMVLNERRWETCGMERSCMGRFFTMQRHEILHLQKNYRDPGETSLNPNLTLSEEFYYFPIPDNERFIVPDLINR